MNKIDNINDDLSLNKDEYFLPHYPVINSSSTITKMRVMFDALG